MNNQIDTKRKDQEEQKLHKSNAAANRSNTLDDESRIKVLSPGMLVLKRFIRNKLAITGFVILVVMFVFAFLGGLLTPYGQAEVFKHDEAIMKDYASALFNKELRYAVKTGEDFPVAAQAQMMLALTSKSDVFSSNGQDYRLTALTSDCYAINKANSVASAMRLLGKVDFKAEVDGFEISDVFKAAAEQAIISDSTSFTVENVAYALIRNGKSYNIALEEPFAIASKKVMDAVDVKDTDIINSFEFRYAALKAIGEGGNEFELDGIRYSLDLDEAGNGIICKLNGSDKTEFAALSDILVKANAVDVQLPLELKDAIRKAVAEKQDKFILNDTEYEVDLVNQTYNVKTLTVSRLISRFETPSSKHILGTDGNGMDVLTRLMFGGRVSLLVGFVVVFLETFLGIILGGISGYFGGWVDTCLMRLVDLFNCIPFYPTVMIIGAAMDKMEVKPYPRIFLLMAILGILGWTGIARIVRGQILSLREQDFMVATEATGIRVSRKIFKHLVPNVMPLLIVQATMSLGGIIITEATLSFLGLGIKYPLSSWGCIINAANDQFVLTNYWFIWLPAGLLIVLTVLGFNFVGDGLRDAFDPKMKR